MKTFTLNQISKSVYALLIALSFSTATFATAISAAQSGNWNTTSTWTGGVVPTSADDVTITGFTVTVSDTQTAQSITVQTDATTVGKLIVQATGTLTASTATTPLILKGGEVENAGSMILTTTSTTTGACISFSNTTLLINSGKYSGAGSLILDSSTAASGSAISMSQSQTTGSDPNKIYYGGIFVVGGNYTFNIATARPIFGIGVGRPTIDGTGTISVGTTESPVSHGLIMITTDFGRLTVNPNVTLSIVSNMAVASRGPIYFHNIPNATLINKGTININGSGTNAIGSIASGTGAATLTNEGTMNIAGTYTESAIGINGALAASFNITNTGTFSITGSYPTLPALATPNATNSKLVFTNNANGVLNLNIGNSGIVTASGSRARIINSGGTLAGSGIINGAFEPSTGIIAPGGAGIGKITLAQLQATTVNTNNLTGKCVMNINGKTTAGTDYDQIAFIQGVVDIAGATLEASVGGGYSPALSDKVNLLSATALTGNFSSTVIPANSTLDYAVSTAVSLTFGTTANKFSNENNVRVFNATGKIRIENGMNKSLKIYSVDGKVIRSEIIKSNSVSIESARGIYLVQIDNVRTKVLVQ